MALTRQSIKHRLEIIKEWIHDEIWSRIKCKIIWPIRYRTTDQYHKIHLTELSPNYYEVDTRMLYASFQLLRDYVEIELYHDNYTRKNGIWTGRSPERGLANLDDVINDPSYKSGTAPTQADRAAETKFLYLWWTVGRAQRFDVWGDPAIWSREANEGMPTIGGGTMGVGSAEYQVASDRASHLEEFYNKEDDEMLIRLIKIRHYLWT